MKAKNVATILMGYLILAAQTAAGQGWAQLRPMPAARYGIGAVMWQDKIVVIGGRDSEGNTVSSVDSYDPINDIWSEDFPDLVSERFNPAVSVYQGQIYVVGGGRDTSALNTVEVFDEQSGTWQLTWPLLEAREEPATAVINDRLHVMGGFGDARLYLRSVEILEPGVGWQSASWGLQQARASLAAMAVDDSIFTFGGLFFGPVATVERYHSSDGGVWRKDMPTPRGRLAVVLHDDSLWAIGGAAQTGPSPAVEIFDPHTNVWRTGLPLMTARELHAAVSFYNSIYVIGGRDQNNEPVESIEALQQQATNVSEHDLTVPPSPRLAAFPNPFEMAVKFDILHAALRSDESMLEIYDVLGRRVRSMRFMESWRSVSLTWDGRDEHGTPAPDGIYFTIFRTEDMKLSRKVIKLRGR